MKPVFADTVGFLALWNRSDQWHERAKQAFLQLAHERTTLITTSFVLLECANAASRKPYRLKVDLLRLEMEQSGYLIFPTDSEWHVAWEHYAASEAHGAGVVDHVSFIVMRRLGITHAFSNDRHFQAAGFELLF